MKFEIEKHERIGFCVSVFGLSASLGFRISDFGFTRRSGFTMIELIFFVAIFAISMSLMIPFIFQATESRLLQQTVALVEDNGTQVSQKMIYRIRHAEKILAPAIGQTGSVLALQQEADNLNPTIFGVQTGVLLMIEGAIQESVTSTQVAVDEFVVTNTSPSASHPSVTISYSVSRTIRLQAPHSYSRTFDIHVNLFPDNELKGNSCGCTAPSCTNNVYSWQVCSSSSCSNASANMKCD
jgi:type II secretory pathway pseudopilin PulG